MRGTRLAAILLMAIGALALAYPVITYTTREKVLDIGPIEVTTSEEHRVPLTPIVGGAAVLLGAALFLTGRRRG